MAPNGIILIFGEFTLWAWYNTLPVFLLQDQFQCKTGECLWESWVCDNESDCPGSEDEENCPDLTCSGFQCRHSSGCIHSYLKCNGHNDCADGWVYWFCVCPPVFTCFALLQDSQVFFRFCLPVYMNLFVFFARFLSSCVVFWMFVYFYLLSCVFTGFCWVLLSPILCVPICMSD